MVFFSNLWFFSQTYGFFLKPMVFGTIYYMTAGIYSKSIFTPYKTNLEPSLIYPVSGPGGKGTGDFQITDEVIAAIKINKQRKKC
jgi:hypothetical protein